MDPISFSWEDPSCSWLPELKSHHLDVILEPGTTVLQLPCTGTQETCKQHSVLKTTNTETKRVIYPLQRPLRPSRGLDFCENLEWEQIQARFTKCKHWSSCLEPTDRPMYTEEKRGERDVQGLLCNCLRKVLCHSCRLAFINCGPQGIYLDALPDHLQPPLGFSGTAPYLSPAEAKWHTKGYERASQQHWSKLVAVGNFLPFRHSSLVVVVVSYRENTKPQN